MAGWSSSAVVYWSRLKTTMLGRRTIPWTGALNRPAGQVVEGLLDWTLSRSADEGGLPRPVKRLLEEVCDPGAARYRTGRVMVASRVLPLWVRDEAWTVSHVLPLFDWCRSETEARVAWRGFLWAPRLQEGFLAAVRRSFIGTARHYGELGSHGPPYAGLLTSAGLHLRDAGWTRDIKEAVGELPEAGLQQALTALGRGLARGAAKGGLLQEPRTAVHTADLAEDE